MGMGSFPPTTCPSSCCLLDEECPGCELPPKVLLLAVIRQERPLGAALGRFSWEWAEGGSGTEGVNV